MHFAAKNYSLRACRNFTWSEPLRLRPPSMAACSAVPKPPMTSPKHGGWTVTAQLFEYRACPSHAQCITFNRRSKQNDENWCCSRECQGGAAFFTSRRSNISRTITCKWYGIKVRQKYCEPVRSSVTTTLWFKRWTNCPKHPLSTYMFVKTTSLTIILYFAILFS